MSEAAVAVRELVKRYPKRPSNAVDGIDFAVAPGEVFGLLGPNGAGKTTTLGILTTRVVPTSGTATVGGVDVAADPVRARTVLSVVPQQSNLDRSLSARQNLVFHAAYHGMGRADRNRRADELLDRMGLGDRGKDRVDDYSGGMAQRLLIARALMHRPRVLFLDEPSTGLDPQARLFVWDQVRELRDAGATVVVTTHDMDEAAELSDRVGIMDHGGLLALDTPTALTRSLPGEATVDLAVAVDDQAAAGRVREALGALRGVRRSEDLVAQDVEQDVDGADAAADEKGGSGRQRGAGADTLGPTVQLEVRVRLYLDSADTAVLGPAAEAVERAGGRLQNVALGEPTLEDVFIQLTGRDLR